MNREQRRKANKGKGLTPDKARNVTYEYEGVYSMWLQASGTDNEMFCTAIKNDKEARIYYNDTYMHDDNKSFAISIANSVGTYGEPFVWDGVSPVSNFWVDVLFLLKLIASKVDCERFTVTVNEFVKSNQSKALNVV